MILAKLGLLESVPACTDSFTQPWTSEAEFDEVAAWFQAPAGAECFHIVRLNRS